MALSVYKCVCIIFIDNPKMFVYNIIFCLQRFFAQNYLGHFFAMIIVIIILRILSVWILAAGIKCIFREWSEWAVIDTKYVPDSKCPSKKAQIEERRRKVTYGTCKEKREERYVCKFCPKKLYKWTCTTLRPARYVWAYWSWGLQTN